MSIPYRIALISKATFCVPVENPVPAKNNASPKFLKTLRHWVDMLLFLYIFVKTYPTISPTINVQAVVPKDREAILIFPQMFPKRTIRPLIMLMYGKEASNRKQEIDRQHYTIPNQRPKDKHCGKI